MRPLLVLLILGVSGANCGSHTLQYYYTGISEPGHGLPVFVAVGYVDEIQIKRYDSNSHIARPSVQWMETVEGDPGYWERETQNLKDHEAIFKHNVKTVMSRFNQTAETKRKGTNNRHPNSGFHSYQEMYGCDLYDDGSTRGYIQDGYDGREFTTLDTDRWIYVPIMTEAQITAQRVNSPEVGAAENDKNYLQGRCIEYLRKYIRAGSAELERKVISQVKVSGHQSDAVTKLHCRVYGFYPKAVDVKWVKNGEIDLMSEEAAQVLPNPDGTYQLRVTVEVIRKDGDSFFCHVDHSSLKEPLTVLWEPKKSQTNLIIIVAVVGVLLIIAAGVGGYFIYRKKNHYTRPQVTDEQEMH
ncbi:H-2 class I histocompatibility antigen, Q9 alpha chain isoform X2 [Bombina bombina]|uniref:H-2 class I histocompatibility antigen, Q9 alpha chain isoform X2 n=1 Tax=Bombina bombina TaxID=8345 RepID=UPI00235A95AE|nr:H-2 class I histocompatibility antigen, Q9 alpha chain isoform X2 [Bombina bombina]